MPIHQTTAALEIKEWSKMKRLGADSGKRRTNGIEKRREVSYYLVEIIQSSRRQAFALNGALGNQRTEH